MRSTFRVFCYIDRQKVRADGTTAVWCRLSIDGKRAVLTTGLYCRPEMWNARRGEILSPRENNQLEAFRQRVVRTYEQMLEEQGVVSAAMLKERLVGRHPVPTTLLATGEAELERLELIRRMFLFSCLTGLAYADMQSLYPRHIGLTAEGRSYIRKQRVKTRIEAFIPLHPIAEQILSLYNRTDDTQPVFPLGPRDGIWFDIHQLGIIVGIRENLSYHQSRHSFGTLAISAGLSIESIAKMMGHANISTTQGYAQITEQKISEDMDRLIRRRVRRQDESQSNM